MREIRSLPAPLLTNCDETADALRTGNREFGAAIDEAAAFVSLSARVSSDHPGKRSLYFAIPAFAALALALIVVLRPRPVVTIAADSLAGVPSARAVRAAAPRDKVATSPTSEDRLGFTGPRRAVVAPQRASASASSQQPGDAASRTRGLAAATPTSTPSPSGEKASEPPRSPVKATPEGLGVASAALDCLRLARQGATGEAEQCFVERARGSGLGAEMALYELGRLRRNVLGDPQGALLALEEHGARFPAGSLRREVEMSYLELLVQVGRSREALERSNALLQAQSGGERAAELRLLRGDVFRRKLHDLRAAEREYGLAEQLAGAAEAEATYLRGVCLEGLSESIAAGEAYRRYLSKASRPRAAEVQRRLERLSAP